MGRRVRFALGAVIASLFGASWIAHAGEVTIERVVFASAGAGSWTVHTTLRHADTGWEHYADAWRVVDREGRELGVRTLYHPHVDEQPFTRSLGRVAIDPGVREVWVEAHDKLHGWSAQRIRVDLSRAEGPGYRVER